LKVSKHKQTPRRRLDLARFGPLPLAKALMREQAVRHFRLLLDMGIRPETALVRTAAAFRFRTSSRSLRRWDAAYQQSGFLGMFERKQGRSGRKPKQLR